MTKRVLIGAAAALLALAVSVPAYAQQATPLHFGVAGGAAVPMGNTADISKTGYNVTGLLEMGLPVLPALSIRGELAYNQLDMKPINGSWKLFGGQVNAAYSWPLKDMPVRPYLIGGLGAFNVKADPTDLAAPASKTKFAWNAGAGVGFKLGTIETVVEARFQQIAKEKTLTNDPLNFIPLTIGLVF